MKKKLLFALLIFVSFGISPNVNAQTKKENETWFKKQEWLGGLKLQPSFRNGCSGICKTIPRP